MYPVSEAFLRAVQENTRRYYWTGRITTKGGAVYPFRYEDIVKGSGYISAQCCGSAGGDGGTRGSTEDVTVEVERVTEENMVTEAVNDILGMNPMEVFFSEERLADVLSWNDVLLPVCPNMVGGDGSAFLRIKKLDIGDLGKARQVVLFEAVEMDFERDLLYSICFEDSSVRVRKVRLSVFSVGLNEELDDSTYTVLEEHAVSVETFLFLGSYTLYQLRIQGMTFQVFYDRIE